MGKLAVVFAFAWGFWMTCIGAGTRIPLAVLVHRSALGKTVHRLLLEVVNTLNLFGGQEFAVFLVVLLA